MAQHVRSLTETEGNHLQHVLRHGRNSTAVRRSQVIQISGQGLTVQEIVR